MTPTEMARIHAASFARGWTVAEIETLLRKPTTHAIATEHGFAMIQLIAPEAEILTIAIDPDQRGQGLGAALLAETLCTARVHGAEKVFLEVDAHNSAARALYASAGFQTAGHRRDYYTHADGTQSHAILLTRAIRPGT